MTNAEVDPSRCPLCGVDNQCGMVEGAATCWCFAEPPAEVLAKGPPEARDLACVCRICATGERSGWKHEDTPRPVSPMPIRRSPSGDAPSMVSKRPLTEPHASRPSTDQSTAEAAMAAHAAAEVAGEPGYIDPTTGLFVFTASHLAKRRLCCGSGCRHCPYVGPTAPQGAPSAT
ncbi:MAG: cysteine-rich CWC family protein [Actinomycetota bacterium]